MQIDRINSVNFGAINSKKATSVLYSRLNRPDRYVGYECMLKIHEGKKYNIDLETFKENGLLARVFDQNGSEIFSRKEGFFSRVFDRSPVRFIENVTKSADAYIRNLK